MGRKHRAAAREMQVTHLSTLLVERTAPYCAHRPPATRWPAGLTGGDAVATNEDFEALEIRVGTVVDAEPLAGAAMPSIRLWIDFGTGLGVKASAAQITVHYPPDRLIGRQVLAVTNFPPRRIAGFVSEVLTLGVPDEDGAVVLVRPDFKVPDGGRLF